MAVDSVNKLTQDLAEAELKVKELTASIDKLTQELIGFHAEAAKTTATGGVATPAGVLASQQRLREDPEKWGGRVGGG